MAELTSAALPGARPDDHIRGPDGAPLLVLYADFTCVRCAVAAQQLKAAPVRVAYRHLVLRSRGPRVAALAHAAEAAALQGAFWPFHDGLFADQGRQDDPHLWAHCETLGIDVERFDSDRRGRTIAAGVATQTREALRGGAVATPTLVLPGGEIAQGGLDEAIAAVSGGLV